MLFPATKLHDGSWLRRWLEEERPRFDGTLGEVSRVICK
jgi:hypothetical protein